MPTTNETFRGRSKTTSSRRRPAARSRRAGPGSKSRTGSRAAAPRSTSQRTETFEIEADVDSTKVEELLLQALETELGGVQVYEMAVKCATNEELREEWEKYLDQTRNHVDVVTRLCSEQGVDAAKESPGRRVVRHLGESLVEAMRQAQASGDPDAAQIVAAECVLLAENKDHMNWSLIGEVAKTLGREEGRAFQEAYDEVEDEEDEHLYHTMGWARELWIECLGMPAVLPPPEEKRDVKSAIGAAKAKAARKKSIKRGQ